MTKKNYQLLMLLSAVGLMAFTACTTDKYDLGDLDTTIGVGSDEGLTLPTSSTKEIFLDDLLELNEDENVKIKDNGDYVFEQKGDDVDPIDVTIEEIHVKDNESKNIPFELQLTTLPEGADLSDLSPFMGQTLEGTAGSYRDDIFTIDYLGDKPVEIKKLKEVETDATLYLHIDFPENISNFIPSFTAFELTFPTYMDIELPENVAKKFELKGNILQPKNGEKVSTAENLDIAVNIKKLTLDGANLKETDDKIMMTGGVALNVAWDDIVVGGKTLNTTFANQLEIGEIVIKGATGTFTPTIDMDDLGSVEIGDLPDFLTDEDVELDLYNPQIVVNIKSTLYVPGYMTGTLTAKKKDGEEIVVNIPKVKINSAEVNEGISNILICRQNIDTTGLGYTDYQAVENLKYIINALTDIETIQFGVTAGAETSSENSRIELGVPYTIQPSYSIEAPIAFGERARIVYNDVLDGWNDDIQDYEFANEAYVEVTANIENCIPAYLTMSAHAIDINGNEIDNLTAEVSNTIAASKDGETPETTPITITIKQKAPGALQAVDGINFTIEASASDEKEENPITGITLNAKKHSMKATNIKVTLKGKVIIKTDD